VIVTAGSSARKTEITQHAPVDLVIVGVIDSLEVGGNVTYRKSWWPTHAQFFPLVSMLGRRRRS
jgi:hypothetical protein